DVDGDGVRDIVLGSTCVSRKSGGELLPKVTSLPIVPSVVADFDGDSQVDLLGVSAIGYAGALSLCRGLGGGRFADPQILPSGDRVLGVAAIDENGDGRLDPISVTRGYWVSVFRNEGAGDYSIPDRFFVHRNPTQEGDGPLIDYNGDGHVDVLRRRELFLGDSTGNFEYRSLDEEIPTLGDWLAKSDSFVLLAEDFDGDGRLDYVRRERDGRVELFWPDAGTAATFTTLTAGEDYLSGWAIADFDGDGDSDLAVSSTNPQNVYVFSYESERRFSDPSVYDISNKMSAQLEPGDFDGDGDVDLLVLFDGTKILENRGDGTFDERHPQYLERDWPIAIGDVDGNGADDLIYEGSVIRLGDLPGVEVDLDATQHPGKIFPAPGETLWGAGDYDGDGDIDLLTRDSYLRRSGTVLEGYGDATWGNPTQLSFSLPFWSTMLGDVNGDGAPDLVGFLSEGFVVGLNRGTPPGFRRGEVTGDGTVDISDAVRLLDCLFRPIDLSLCTACDDSRDVNDDGAHDVSDGVKLLLWLFTGGTEPPGPFTDCGRDTTPDSFTCVDRTSCL
ncbi:MAG: FG-GAP-like repeat-containing protein, partial [Planctomycetota bacterium]